MYTSNSFNPLSDYNERTHLSKRANAFSINQLLEARHTVTNSNFCEYSYIQPHESETINTGLFTHNILEADLEGMWFYIFMTNKKIQMVSSLTLFYLIMRSRFSISQMKISINIHSFFPWTLKLLLHTFFPFVANYQNKRFSFQQNLQEIVSASNFKEVDVTVFTCFNFYFFVMFFGGNKIFSLWLKRYFVKTLKLEPNLSQSTKL